MPQPAAPAVEGPVRTGTVTARFPASPSSVRLARALVREVLARHQVEDDALVSVAELLTSELVTNAVRYGRSDVPDGDHRGPGRNGRSGGAPDGAQAVTDAAAFTVRIAVAPHDLTVSVVDASTTAPAVSAPREDGGRGLQIVDTLATAWGSEPQDRGKTVWFQLYRPAD